MQSERRRPIDPSFKNNFGVKSLIVAGEIGDFATTYVGLHVPGVTESGVAANWLIDHLGLFGGLAVEKTAAAGITLGVISFFNEMGIRHKTKHAYKDTRVADFMFRQFPGLAMGVALGLLPIANNLDVLLTGHYFFPAVPFLYQ